jgi:Cysteine sulfinate desulfinase/cysteine desulfurase and related enzymes
MKEIYLDNAATTKPYDSVCQAVSLAMQENYANPSSLHTLGMKSEKAVRAARSVFAKCLGADASEIYFTSGGTESDNLSILGFCLANKKRFSKIVTTKIEHDAVLETAHFLESSGFEVSYVNVLPNGVLDLEDFKHSLTPNTGLVSVMSVNNEVGAIQPIAFLKKIMKSICPEAVLHVDHVQGFGKVDLNVKKYGIDLLSVSGHKIHGPKGIGLLYIREGLHISPIIYGGHQEKNMRSGTQSVYDIVGFATAAKENVSAGKNAHITHLRNQMAQKIKDNIPDIVFNTSLEDSAPHVLNVSFEKIRSEVLLHCLESNGIYVSTGSACSSNKPELSHTLLAMGRTKQQIDGAIRFSFSEFNTIDEVDETIEVLIREVSNLRKYIRR